MERSYHRLAPWVLGMFGLVWAGAGCGVGPTASPDAKLDVPPLRIAAAADLQKVLPRLVTAYRAHHEAAVTPTFGASGRLAEQIRQGAPFDVFLSADLKFVRDLGDQGVVESGSVKPYAQGSLVLVVHPAVGDAVGAIADLNKPEVRKISIANPQFAPYGRAAREALERSGLWTALEPKIVLAESVRQALAYEELGDAEAALVSRSLIEKIGHKVIDIDPALYSPLIQGLGIVARSAQHDRARDFVDFVLGAEGQGILGELGFQPPEVGVEPGRR